MPTYEYRCRDCGEDLEVQQSFTDDPLTECPACGGSLKKIFGNVGIAFKGSGFYKTDSRSGGGSGRCCRGSIEHHEPRFGHDVRAVISPGADEGPPEEADRRPRGSTHCGRQKGPI